MVCLSSSLFLNFSHFFPSSLPLFLTHPYIFCPPLTTTDHLQEATAGRLSSTCSHSASSASMKATRHHLRLSFTFYSSILSSPISPLSLPQTLTRRVAKVPGSSGRSTKVSKHAGIGGGIGSNDCVEREASMLSVRCEMDLTLVTRDFELAMCVCLCLCVCVCVCV